MIDQGQQFTSILSYNQTPRKDQEVVDCIISSWNGKHMILNLNSMCIWQLICTEPQALQLSAPCGCLDTYSASVFLKRSLFSFCFAMFFIDANGAGPAAARQMQFALKMDRLCPDLFSYTASV